MRLVIFGSRDWDPSDADIDNEVRVVIAQHFNSKAMLDEDPGDLVTGWIDEIVCGMAPGADASGFRWAESRRLKVAKFPADWKRHGRAAGPIRNRQMAEYATHGLGFWKGGSRGTANMVATLRALGKPVRVVEWKK